jgi:hypothetical protein
MAMEFHVSRAARDRYGFDEALFSLTGNVVLANFPATRRFAQLMNQRRDLAAAPERAVLAGQLNAMGLIDEILHFVVHLYREQVDPTAIARALAALDRQLGDDAVDTVLATFVDTFPTVAAYRGEIDPATYLAGTSEGIPTARSRSRSCSSSGSPTRTRPSARSASCSTTRGSSGRAGTPG